MMKAPELLPGWRLRLVNEWGRWRAEARPIQSAEAMLLDEGAALAGPRGVWATPSTQWANDARVGGGMSSVMVGAAADQGSALTRSAPSSTHRWFTGGTDFFLS
jgi:hypothetical protein